MTEMVLAAADVPGLLADVAGVLYANRIEVVDAAIYSRSAGRDRGARGARRVPGARQHGPPGDRRGALDQGGHRSGGRRGRADQGGDPGGRPPAHRVGGELEDPRVVPTESKIDNNVSRDFSIVEVITEDRPGVLYAIARTLYVAGLDIHRSKIATEANRAVDVFYVRDKATMDKIIDPERQGSLRETLLALLAGVESTKLAARAPSASDRCDRCAITVSDWWPPPRCRWPRGPARRRCWRRGSSFSARTTSRARSRRSTTRPRPIPSDARPHYLKGVALEKKGDSAAAMSAYKQAIKLKADFAEAHNNLGALLLAKNDLPAAAARARGGGEGEARLPGGALQPGRRSRRAGQDRRRRSPRTRRRCASSRATRATG